MNHVRELIQARAAENGDREYLVFEDQRFSVADLDQRSRQVAAGFLNLGVKKSDRVAVLMDNCPEFIFVWWALLRMGAVMVPVNTRLGPAEIAYIFNHSEAVMVVAENPFHAMIETFRPDCGNVRFWLGTGSGGIFPDITEFFVFSGPPDPGMPPEISSNSPPDIQLDRDDPALILYTSGTTGFPKGVIHTHGDYLLTAESFARTFALTPKDRLITANPLFHVNAQFYSCMGTLFASAVLILVRKFSASRWWGWTRRYQANKAVLLLALATILDQREPSPDDADNPVEVVMAGGVPQGREADFERRFGLKLQTLYSLTEAPMALMSPADEPCRSGAVGIPMLAGPGIKNEVQIVDEALRPVPPGQKGEINIRNPAVLKGYLKDPAATADTLSHGWVRTGDLGVMDADGWVRFLGRAKDVIRKKGENISAAQVEAVLAAHPDVAEAAVIGVRPDDAAGEEEVMAFVVFRVSAGLCTALNEDPRVWNGLVAHCKAHLAEFKVPRFWKAVSGLPKNAMNRVVKKRLTENGSPERSSAVHDRKEYHT